MDISFPLLEDIITTTDMALEDETIGANLRFAHAETLMPFVSLIKVDSYGRQARDLLTIASYWKNSLVSPMAGKWECVFYQA